MTVEESKKLMAFFRGTSEKFSVQQFKRKTEKTKPAILHVWESLKNHTDHKLKYHVQNFQSWLEENVPVRLNSLKSFSKCCGFTNYDANYEDPRQWSIYVASSSVDIKYVVRNKTWEKHTTALCLVKFNLIINSLCHIWLLKITVLTLKICKT